MFPSFFVYKIMIDTMIKKLFVSSGLGEIDDD